VVENIEEGEMYRVPGSTEYAETMPDLLLQPGQEALEVVRKVVLSPCGHRFIGGQADVIRRAYRAQDG
jgi:hypothetical protein